MKAQGTELYTIDPADGSVIVVGCPTSIDGIDTSVDQNETTCLNSLARTYEAGLATPGTATFGIQTNPQDPSHVRLHQLKIAGTTLQWAVGWSDGTGTDPTVETNSDGEYEFVLPNTRSWVTFEGFMNSFPFSFALNSQVTSTVGIQISGEPVLTPATAS
jgi:tail tube protein